MSEEKRQIKEKYLNRIILGLKMEDYEGLCISSGGFKGIGILGFLQAQHFNGKLHNCTYFSGTSVGSAICLLFAVGWTPYELFLKVINIKLFSSFADLDLYGFQNEHGLVDIKLLKEEIEPLVIQKRINKKTKLPTLLDLHREGIYIAFSVTDRVSRQNVKLDYKSHPSLLATDACLWSCSIPFIIKPSHYKGMILSDGALSNPFPVNYIDNGKRKILGISAFGSKETASEGFLDHITNTFMIPVEELQRGRAKAVSDSVDVVELVVHDINILDQNASDMSKCKMFLKGTEDGMIFYNMLCKKKDIIKARKKLNNRHHKNIKPVYHEDKSHSKPTKIELEIPHKVIYDCLTSQPLRILSEFSKRHPREMLNIYDRLNPRDAQLIYNFLSLFEVGQTEKEKIRIPQPEPKKEVKRERKPRKKKEVKTKPKVEEYDEIIIEEAEEIKPKRRTNRNSDKLYDNFLDDYSNNPNSTADKLNRGIYESLNNMPDSLKPVLAEGLQEIGEDKIRRGIQGLGLLVDTFKLLTRSRTIGWSQPIQPPRSPSQQDRNVIGEILRGAGRNSHSPKVEIMDEE